MDDPLNGFMSITTTGKGAHGIFAQNLGGGGGYVYDLNGKAIPLSSNSASRRSMEGVGGNVSIVTRGDIIATGEGSYGIWIQNGRQKADGSIEASEARSGSNYIEYTGKIVGGSGSGAAIRIDGGAFSNVVLNPGSDVRAESGIAVLGIGGDKFITNYGRLAGDIDFGSRLNQSRFVNEASGTYVSREGDGQLKLGLGNTSFVNKGMLDIAGQDKIGTLTVEAGINQLSGELRVDINSLAAGRTSDQLMISRANIDNLFVRPHATGGLLPGTYAILSSSAIAMNGAVGATPLFSEASPISWKLNREPHALTVTPSGNFVKAGDWSANERAMMNSWQQGWNTSSVAEAPIFAQLANIETAQDYRDAVDSMAYDSYQSQAVSQTLGARASLNAALSCPIFADDSVMIEETQCAWSRVSGSRIRQFETSATDGFTQTGLNFRLGGQVEIADDWFLGATAGYSSTRFKSGDGYVVSEGDSGDVAIALKRQIGPWLFAVSGQVGYGSFDTTQQFDFGDTIWQAESDPDMWTTGVRFRTAYEFAMLGWYVRPYVDVDALYTYGAGFSTQGLPGVEMDVSAVEEWTFSISPAVEVGARLDLDARSWLRPYASVGATFIHSDGHSASISFDSGQSEGIDFVSTSNLLDVLLDVGLGVQYFALEKYELRGEYKAQLAEDYLAQEASVRLSVRF